MKRIIPIILLAVLFLAVTCFKNAVAEESGAVLAYLSGSVNVSHDGQNWQPAVEGEELSENDWVQTLDNGYCNIILTKDQNITISLEASTQIKIGQYWQKVNISRGRIFTIIKDYQKASDFQVVTPVAVAGARGTAWETIVDLKSIFNVLEGVVYVRGISPEGRVTGEIDVPNGNSVEVDENGNLGELKKLLADILKKLQEWLDKILNEILLAGYEDELSGLFTRLLEKDLDLEPASFVAANQPGGPAIEIAPVLTDGDIPLSYISGNSEVQSDGNNGSTGSVAEPKRFPAGGFTR